MQKSYKLFILLLLFTTKCIAQVVPTSGLVAYYTFTGNALDSTNNSYDLTVHNGASLCTDRFGREYHAYQFDGIDDYLSYPTPLPQTGDFTFSFWYMADTLTQRGSLFHNGSGPTNGLGVMQNAGIVNHTWPGDRIAMYAGGLNYYTQIVTNTNAWHHVVIRRSGTTMDLFYDNILNYTGSFTINTPTSQFSIGYNVSGNNLPFKGKMDDFILYNRSLSIAEIDTLFKGCGPQIAADPVSKVALSASTTIFTVSAQTNAAPYVNYQWQRDTGTGFVNLANIAPFSGVNDDTLIVNNVTTSLNNNDFRVILSNNIGCKDTSTAAKLMVTPNSINDITDRSGLVVFPNPSKGEVRVNTTGMILSGVCFLEVKNVLGQTIERRKFPGPDLKDLRIHIQTRGVYILAVLDSGLNILGRSKVIIE